MEKIQSIHDGKAIAFAFYKTNAEGKKELMGYRMDTVGSIGKRPKIYTYSHSQVRTCLDNINTNVKTASIIGKGIKEQLGPSRMTSIIANAERKIHNILQEARAFEVRVVECPDYPKEFDVEEAKEVRVWEYPTAAIEEWIKEHEQHKVIETHLFSMDGELNLQ